MAIETIKLGTLYQNNSPVLFNTSTPVQYISNASLELKASVVDVNYQIEWLKFQSGAKLFLLSTRNILINISYSDLSKQSLISGNITTTLNGIKYKIRLLTSQEWDDFVLNQVGLTSLLTPTTKDLTGTYTEVDISTSETNNLLHWWQSPSLVQSDTDVITRGGNNIGASTTISTTTGSGYRILLEKYNSPPTISGSDTNLGNFTTYITKTYSVVDPDDDLFKITISLDNVVIQTLENQASKTDFVLNLESQWSTLSESKHTILIEVQDIYGNIVQRKFTFTKLSTENGTSNALVRPQIVTGDSSTSSLNPIDGRMDNTFTFRAVGGELIVAHEFSIVNNLTQVEIYRRKVETYEFTHIVPSNSITNGNTYQLKVRTYNQSGQYSSWSDIVLVKALTPPDITINTIVNERIETGNPLFTSVVDFIESEGDSLYSYEYLLYKDGVLVAYSDELTDGLLSYQFTNLENKTNYEIELVVRTVYGNIVSLKQSFYCVFLQARLPAVIELKNNPKTGSININTYVRQIIGRIYSGDDVYYIGDEWADLHNSVVIYDKDSAFRLSGNWTTKIWARDLEDTDNMLIKFTMEDGYIVLSRWKNMFSLARYVGKLKLYELHSFIQGEILSTDVFYFFIQNDVDLGLMNFEVKRVTEGRTTWFNPTHTEDISPTYQTENGFLNNINHDLLNLILPKTIDNQNSIIYIPSIEDFDLDIFKSLLPTQDTESDYNLLKSDIVFSRVGSAIIGQSRIFSGSYLGVLGSSIGTDTVIGNSLVLSDTIINSLFIYTRNLYSGNSPFKIKYKIHNMSENQAYSTEKIDGIVINSNRIVTDDIDYIIDLTNIWSELSYGNHVVKITVSNGLYIRTKELTFTKPYNICAYDESNIISEFVTRTIDTNDTNKLIAINELGNNESVYPIQSDGIRIMFDLPLTTKISKHRNNSDLCYTIITNPSVIFTTQTIDNLNIGDKVKEYSTRYNNKLLRFTIVNKLNDRVILMADNTIANKMYDESENTFINGNPNWNLSNLKQWLNNNTKIG